MPKPMDTAQAYGILKSLNDLRDIHEAKAFAVTILGDGYRGVAVAACDQLYIDEMKLLFTRLQCAKESM